MSRLKNQVLIEFLKRLDAELPNHGHNQKASFHAVNDKFEKDAGFKPYSSYDSFKTMKSRRGKDRERGN